MMEFVSWSSLRTGVSDIRFSSIFIIKFIDLSAYVHIALYCLAIMKLKLISRPLFQHSSNSMQTPQQKKKTKICCSLMCIFLLSNNWGHINFVFLILISLYTYIRMVYGFCILDSTIVCNHENTHLCAALYLVLIFSSTLYLFFFSYFFCSYYYSICSVIYGQIYLIYYRIV